MFKNKNVLVTGGSGMIGRELVKLLISEGAIVYIADLRKPTNMDYNHFYDIDLKNFSDCLNISRGKDYIFNLVGIKCSPKVCLERPADIMGPMLQFNTNMLEAAMKNNVNWYLYTSTVGVYHPAEVLKEDDVWKTQPSKNDWYGGWAKRMGELQCKAYEVQFGEPKCSIVRPANVYGSYDNFDPSSAMVIPSLIRKAYENKVLEVWGDGTPIRDFIHAKDVARGMIHIVKNKISEPINLGSGNGISIKIIAETIANEFNRKIKWLTDAPKGDARRVFDMTRANSYGYQPEISIEDGLKETIKWFIENKDEVDNRYDVFKK